MSAALKDDAAASATRSESTRKSKARSAETNRKKAVEFRAKAATATAAAGKAQAAATKAQQDAAAERSRRSKRAAEQTKRDDRAAQREVERQERQRKRADNEIASRLSGLDASTQALSVKTADLEAAIEASRRAAPHKITVLLIAGTPEGGSEPLRIDREARAIDAKVQASMYRDQIALEWIQATRVGDIIDALNRFSPAVVHFSGHGSADSLLFEAPDGTPHEVSGDRLALLLQAAPRPIRLMVFNACNSAEQARSATDWADFSIGMERSIGDDAAKEWAGQFYGSLGSGATIDLAFRQATAQATVLTSAHAAGDPQLFESEAADAKATVLVTPQTSA
jgi:hypothetical protein